MTNAAKKNKVVSREERIQLHANYVANVAFAKLNAMALGRKTKLEIAEKAFDEIKRRLGILSNAELVDELHDRFEDAMNDALTDARSELKDKCPNSNGEITDDNLRDAIDRLKDTLDSWTD